MRKLTDDLNTGFILEQGFISDEMIKVLIDDITQFSDQKSPYGIRNADKKFASIRQLVQSEKILTKAKSILGKKPQLVRVIFFDKTPDKNWLVAWHQDKTVSVNKKYHINGWGPWSIKDNTHHVQPCESVLNNMVTFRIHLDNTDANNGCLKVMPNSHTNGVLTQVQINTLVNNAEYIECEANAGDMLIMRPLILHASSKAKQPQHRRVIHIEFSSFDLPDGVFWQ